ncbi:MAG: T9SS type A sorting domain-containing protein [Candidatus Stahlbacteria bacterium]|nr:T9SS type A sorting domain-containing protein [Candidatus Stahlbacteria bacterium]
MKKGFSFVITIVGTQFIVSSVIADTTYVSGVIDTNTVWDTAGSPYIVIGDVTVNSLVTLDIEPGVEVRIDSMKQIMVKGNLYAIGTAADSILITHFGTAGWHGLRFTSSASACSLKYCRIEYANNSAIDNNGSIYIGYNTISNNSATYDNGIFNSESAADITNNTISNNFSYREGGGICNYDGTVTINNNTISNNSADDYGSGIYNDGIATINNNTISNNSADYGGSICNSGTATIKYNTIEDTTASVIYIDFSDSTFIDSNNLYATGYAVYNNSTKNIPAYHNYWGTASADTIAMKIWDYYDDFTKGKVYYEPFAVNPYDFGVEEREILKQVQNDRLEIYPNPSFGNAVIKYGLPNKTYISLKLYNLSGRLVKTIHSGTQAAGYYKISLSRVRGPDLPEGIYFIQLKSNEFTITRKLIIL